MAGKTLTVALIGRIDEALSPENISTIPLYHIHYNLWNRLLGRNGSPAVAKSFNVSQDQLTYTFYLDEEAKFSNGRAIQAEDIKFTVDRLIAREKNGHINAKTVIGAATVNSPLSISITLKETTPSFIYLVSSPEFGIVPREACDSAGNVTALVITSGAYHVENLDLKSQKFEFAKNATYRHADPAAPSKVILLFKDSSKAMADSMAAEEADFFELYDGSGQHILEENNGPYIAQVTKPSVSTFLAAKDAISPVQAKYIAWLFRNEFSINFESDLEKRSRQLLPPRSFASLDDEELATLDREKIEKVALPSGLTIQTSRPKSPIMDLIIKFFSKFGSTVTLVGYDYKGPVHFEASGQGMNLNFPEIELNLAILSPYAYVSASAASKSALRDAIHEPDDAKRAGLLKKVGRELLSDGHVIPFTIRSYVHIYNKKRIDARNITDYDGEIPFFKIRML